MKHHTASNISRENGGVRSRAVAAPVLVALAFAASAAAATPGPVSQARCGAATAAALAAADGSVARDIYRNELGGTEVRWDLAHVTSASDLLNAVARDDPAAARAAVSRIVYHRHWHIVRLRALDLAGRVLADVGGPHVIAPVTGTLRSGGRVIGSFVMSVQDDAGVVKLAARFIGDPVGIYVAGTLVASRAGPLPATAPGGTSLRLGSAYYGIVRQTDAAFPSGTLTLVLLVPAPRRAQAALPCPTVRVGEFARVAATLARLASMLSQHYVGYAATVQQYTGALVFVRDGSTQLASSGGDGPATLPQSGTVSYLGASWLVASFVALPPARIYVLVAPS